MDTIELADGGLLLYERSFLSPETADRYYSELRHQVPWEQKPGAFGHLQPRLTVSYGEPGLVYRYSGTVNPALPWTATLLELKAKVEAVRGTYNFCLLNLYRTGSDSVAWHADNEPGVGSVIGSVSLGATRKFRIRHNIKKNPRSFLLESGSLIIMAGTTQQYWQHEVPKTKEIVGERINLTFRMISDPVPARTD